MHRVISLIEMEKEMRDTKKNIVLCQKWEESERGGTRPDGYSLHVDELALKKFIDAYWDRMPDRVPDEYSRPDGTPYWCEVDAEAYEKVVASTNGVSFSSTNYPGSGGVDGWVPLRGGGHGKL